MPSSNPASVPRIKEIDDQITPLERDFSASLGESSSRVQRLLLLTTLIIAVVL